MSTPTSDKVTGKAKEAAGALSDDDELRNEGRADQDAGTIKEKVSDAIDSVKDKVTGN